MLDAVERLSPIDRISHLHELIQITLYIHRHKMKNWNYLCILLLLTLASRGETFSSSVLVGLNLTFVKLLNTSGTKQNGSMAILPKMSQLSITSKQRIPAKSSLLFCILYSYRRCITNIEHFSSFDLMSGTLSLKQVSYSEWANNTWCHRFFFLSSPL